MRARPHRACAPNCITRMGRPLGPCLLALCLLFGPSATGFVRAQQGQTRVAEDPPRAEEGTVPQRATPENRRAAAEAYNRGSAAFLAERYDEAARWFETAHRLLPSKAALMQAIYAHRKGQNGLRAGTLSLRLLGQYGDSADARRLAEDEIRARSAQFVRVRIQCQQCEVSVAGRLLEYPELFLPPDTPTRITGHFASGDAGSEVEGKAGESRTVTLEAPALAPRTSHIGAHGAPEVASEDSSGSAGLSPVWALTAGGLSLASGAVLGWSLYDMYEGVDAYENNPTREALRDGQARETRSNVLIGITGGLLATTLVLAILTDWTGEVAHQESQARNVQVQIGAEPSSDGVAAHLSLTGTF